MLFFVVVCVMLQAATLLVLTDYQMNARHLSFVYVPVFCLLIWPIFTALNRIPKLLFVVPVFLLWGWSTYNQFYDLSHCPEEFKGAAKIINSYDGDVSGVVALCHPVGLVYYGVQEPIEAFQDSPAITNQVIVDCVQGYTEPLWIVLSRPWTYPNFQESELERDFVIHTKHELPGVNLWLCEPLRQVD
jgi:hypothetical protein